MSSKKKRFYSICVAAMCLATNVSAGSNTNTEISNNETDNIFVIQRDACEFVIDE